MTAKVTLVVNKLLMSFPRLLRIRTEFGCLMVAIVIARQAFIKVIRVSHSGRVWGGCFELFLVQMVGPSLFKVLSCQHFPHINSATQLMWRNCGFRCLSLHSIILVVQNDISVDFVIE